MLRIGRKVGNEPAATNPLGLARWRCISVAVSALLNLWLFVPALYSADKPETAREFCQATGGYHFQFPRDHFSHPCYKTEWWYFTGNLSAADGRRFGFELTFFRQAVKNSYPNPSRWRVDNLYLAHFAISDLAAKKFFYTERLNRAGIELAGADQARNRIWNGDWFAGVGSANRKPGAMWQLEASDGGHEIHLRMQLRKPPVLEGINGLSQKSPGAGNASYYYSLTRLETAGQLVVDGTAYQVTGLTWMDHEFFSHSMAPNQVGWDWVSLQMEDGTEWMLYQFRRADSGPNSGHDPFSSATFVASDGRVTHLDGKDFALQPLTRWPSPHSGAQYPVAWRILAPKLGFEAELQAAMPDQELVSGESSELTYWEGSVIVSGKRNGTQVQGRGYLELTGYAGPISSNRDGP